MKNIYEDLLWLPRSPENFSELLTKATSVRDLQKLARFALDESQLRRLYKKILALQNKQINLSPLSTLKIGVISNTTSSLLTPALIGTALRFGISLQILEADFNQIGKDVFSSESIFLGKNLDIIFLAIDYRGLPFSPNLGVKDLSKKNVQKCFDYLKLIIKNLRTKTGAQIILQNIAPPSEFLSGSFERRLIGSLTWLISELNIKIDSLKAANALIFDVAGLASNIGLSNWHDPILWNVAKLSFSQRYIPIYADYFCRILAAKLGKSRRCIISDLDNTLWGGIIGDDGIDGILIGQGDPTAEAHLHLQMTLLKLRERGIILAISSKNEDATARAPFNDHPDMILRENHIAAFQANWSDKATNIREISRMLSLGLESMVFLDDNPAERFLVRNELPEVAVPELPSDPAQFTRTLIAAGYFEMLNFSEEDRNRASFYQDNAKRSQILDESSDINSYLKSLEMKIYCSPFDKIGRARIVQLINKSNQFNLTSKRYTENDIKKIEENQKFYTRQIRLADTFGDNGMISVIICEKHKTFWEIDTWLMSCRVLGRKVEQFAFQEIIMEAKRNGVKKIIGKYIETSRNGIVKEHYKNLGFIKIDSNQESETWEIATENYKFEEIPIQKVNI